MSTVSHVCSVDWCKEKSRTLGYCVMHYARHRKGTDMDSSRGLREGRLSLCSFESCLKTARSNGLCDSHWKQKNHYQIELRKTRRWMAVKSDLVCVVMNCEKLAQSSIGMCDSHKGLCLKYKLTSIQLDFIRAGGCAICGSYNTLHIDHDHSCCDSRVTCGNCVRGALCVSCNHGLGNFKDNPESLKNAIEYLLTGLRQ